MYVHSCDICCIRFELQLRKWLFELLKRSFIFLVNKCDGIINKHKRDGDCKYWVGVDYCTKRQSYMAHFCPRHCCEEGKVTCSQWTSHMHVQRVPGTKCNPPLLPISFQHSFKNVKNNFMVERKYILEIRGCSFKQIWLSMTRLWGKVWPLFHFTPIQCKKPMHASIVSKQVTLLFLACCSGYWWNDPQTQIGLRWKRYLEESTITEKGWGKCCGRALKAAGWVENDSVIRICVPKKKWRSHKFNPIVQVDGA